MIAATLIPMVDRALHRRGRDRRRERDLPGPRRDQAGADPVDLPGSCGGGRPRHHSRDVASPASRVDGAHIVTLLTSWGEDLDTHAPLPEYPRPQLVRPSWQSLNGHWECAFTPFAASDPLAVADPRAASRATSITRSWCPSHPRPPCRASGARRLLTRRCGTAVGSPPPKSPHLTIASCCTSVPWTSPAGSRSMASRSAVTPADTCPSRSTSRGLSRTAAPTTSSSSRCAT